MRLFSSESVTPGHPDKLCDQVSDAILDAYLERDPAARVAVEAMATASGLILAGEVSSPAEVDHDGVARRLLRHLGYPEYARLPIADRIVPQSVEIGAAVSASLEARSGARDPLAAQGAGDQGLMFGYATDETPELMPLPLMMARALTDRLHAVGLGDRFAAIGPDGKAQVTVELDAAGVPVRVASVLISTQHAVELRTSRLEAIVLAEILPALDRFGGLIDLDGAELLLNPSGLFVVGGPAADAGLTGRKIIVDTYGGAARHGGGAFSGKDPSKVDRSGAYAARWVARSIVAAGLARRAEVQIAYAIGRAEPMGLYVETFGTGHPDLAPGALEAAVAEVFDLRPAAIVAALELRMPRYLDTAAYGHFGRPRLPWEAGDRASELMRAALLGNLSRA